MRLHRSSIARDDAFSRELKYGETESVRVQVSKDVGFLESVGQHELFVTE